MSAHVIVYEEKISAIHVDLLFEAGTVWLSQKKMAALFGVNRRTISEHIQNIFTSGELDRSCVMRKARTVAADGKSYNVQFYNLDVIISVGYRVDPRKATRFRLWAMQLLVRQQLSLWHRSRYS